MSYTGPCTWVEKLSTFYDPEMKWSDPNDMHGRCAGTFIYRNPPPSGVGRTYSRCPCQCHKPPTEESIERWIRKENALLDKQVHE